MKNIFFSIIAVLFFSITTNAQSTYKVDPSHSSLVFSLGYNLSDFYGSFGEMEGQAVLKDEKDFGTAEVTFTTQVTSINTNSKGRDGNLQTERYLNAEKNPAASFKSKHIKPLGDNKYEMTGDFTLGGTTLSQTVLVEVKGQSVIGEGEDKKSIMGVKVTFSFNRSNFGITGGIPTMSDKIDIIASLHMIKE
jgi:polyisoprenoid-binding protein YceI